MEHKVIFNNDRVDVIYLGDTKETVTIADDLIYHYNLLKHDDQVIFMKYLDRLGVEYMDRAKIMGNIYAEIYKDHENK